jgi:GDPmannose 4,6-dehydratase
LRATFRKFELTPLGPEFVSRKITLGVAEIALGVAKLIELGNLDARIDWSHSRDIVRGMHLMLQNENPDDFVLSSGVTLRKGFCGRSIPDNWG